MKHPVCLILFVAIMLAPIGAFAQAGKTVIIWQWVDGAGKVHFTNNFNAIPEAYRSKAIQGRFIADRPYVPNTGKGTNPGKTNNTKVTNKLEIYDEQYLEKDDMLVVKGKVRNGFAQSVSNVKMKVTFFDANDNFIREEIIFIEPIQLQPGEEGQYKVEIPFTPDIASYQRVPIME